MSSALADLAGDGERLLGGRRCRPRSRPITARSSPSVFRAWPSTCARADLAGHRDRLLAQRARLVPAVEEHQDLAVARTRTRAQLGRRRLAGMMATACSCGVERGLALAVGPQRPAEPLEQRSRRGSGRASGPSAGDGLAAQGDGAAQVARRARPHRRPARGARRGRSRRRPPGRRRPTTLEGALVVPPRIGEGERVGGRRRRPGPTPRTPGARRGPPTSGRRAPPSGRRRSRRSRVRARRAPRRTPGGAAGARPAGGRRRRPPGAARGGSA